MVDKPTYEELEKRVAEFEQKEAEASYLSTKRALIDVAENFPGMVFQYVLYADGSVSIPYISSKVTEYTGFSPKEVCADPSLFFQPIFKEDREQVNEAIQLSADNLSEFSIVHRLLNPEGKLFWFHVKSTPTKNDDGDIIWNGVSIDISDKKQTEVELRNSEELFRNTFNHAAVGIAQIEPDGKFRKTNPKFEEITGFSKDELSRMSFDKITHPDDLEKESAIINRVLNGEIDSFDIEKRYIHKNGHTVWIELFSNVVRNEAGNVKYAVASVVDITDRKEKENELQSLLDDQTIILNNVPVYIFFKDTENTILRISQAVADVTGLPKEQIEGVHSREIYPGMADEYWKDDLEVINSGKPKLGIVESLPLASGQTRWLLTDKIPYFDDQGKAAGVIVMAKDITDRITSEELLKSSEAKLKSIFRNNPAGIAITSMEDSVIIDCNESLERLSGYTKAELIGRKTTETNFWPKGISQREDVVAQLRRDGSFRNFRIKFITKQNEKRQGLFSAEIIEIDGCDCIITTMFDITELDKVQQELFESQQKYQTMLENIGIGVALISNNMEILELNKQMREWFPSVDTTKRPICHQVFNNPPKDDVCDWCPTYKTLEDGETHESVTKTPGDNGTRNLRIVSTPIIDARGEVQAAIELVEDITDQLKNEEQLRRVQRMESIGDLAGGIAHDFNNILAPIIGISEMLIEDFPPECPESEDLWQIFKAGERGRDLVKQILAFSRQSEQKKIPMSIQRILKEVLKLCRSTIPSYIEITQDIQPDCGMILGDSSQIHQVVMNIITNAFHAIEDTGGIISVTLSQRVLQDIEIGDVGLNSGAYAVIHISDTGHGMSEELIGKIFDPYFTTKAQGKGTGLGLAVVYGIVKEHNGAIKVESEIGKGTTFKVYLPLMEELRPSDSSKDSEKIQGGNERILLVDDEEAIANLEMQVLERLGYKVTSCISSIDALEVFKTNPNSFDLVISDMSMPNMPGDLFASELRGIRPDIPVIICTGFSERIREENLQKMGINGMLMKPILKSDLANIVRKVLDDTK